MIHVRLAHSRHPILLATSNTVSVVTGSRHVAWWYQPADIDSMAHTDPHAIARTTQAGKSKPAGGPESSGSPSSGRSLGSAGNGFATEGRNPAPHGSSSEEAAQSRFLTQSFDDQATVVTFTE